MGVGVSVPEWKMRRKIFYIRYCMGGGVSVPEWTMTFRYYMYTYIFYVWVWEMRRFLLSVIF
jgi:hypothetical protein